MNRRDFWLLRTTPRARVFDLPCERLYMQYLDARRPQASAALEEDWIGEPDARHHLRGAHELFDALARELKAADVVRVIGRSWLADEDLRREVERLVAAFVEHGGRVESI